MTRFFFDISDRDGTVRDDIGIELDNMGEAVAEARRTLGEMLMDALNATERNHFEIRIRDGAEGPYLLWVTSDGIASADAKETATDGSAAEQ